MGGFFLALPNQFTQKMIILVHVIREDIFRNVTCASDKFRRQLLF